MEHQILAMQSTGKVSTVTLFAVATGEQFGLRLFSLSRIKPTVFSLTDHVRHVLQYPLKPLISVACRLL